MKPAKKTADKVPESDFTRPITRALRRAAKRAREEAIRYGTPIHIWKDGKVVDIYPEPKKPRKKS